MSLYSGRVLLVRLETLVTADIVRTVLSFSLDVEIDGVLPGRRAEQDPGSGRAA